PRREAPSAPRLARIDLDHDPLGPRRGIDSLEASHGAGPGGVTPLLAQVDEGRERREAAAARGRAARGTLGPRGAALGGHLLGACGGSLPFGGALGASGA